MILVSACLLGVNCKYNGRNNQLPWIKELGLGEMVPVCPEQLGGLPTPRPASEISGGDGNDVLAGKARVLTSSGKDITPFFVAGAEKTNKIAELAGARCAILKARSPSCGSSCIYDGSFSGRTKFGDGVTAALLKKNGLLVFNEYDAADSSFKNQLPEETCCLREKGHRP